MPEERRQNNINLSTDLSEMKVDVKYMQRDIADIKQALKDSVPIKDMEDIVALNKDHEKRIRVLEKYGTVAVTLLAIAQVIIPYILKNIFQ